MFKRQTLKSLLAALIVTVLIAIVAFVAALAASTSGTGANGINTFAGGVSARFVTLVALALPIIFLAIRAGIGRNCQHAR